MKRIRIDSLKCSGCHLCELICSYWHGGSFNPSQARLHIEVNRVIGLETDARDIDVPHLCHQCEPAPCSEACPVDAFTLNKKLNVFKIDSEICIGCGACAEACPYGMIVIDPEDDNTAHKCDLCGGEPQCVLACPCNALTFESIITVN